MTIREITLAGYKAAYQGGVLHLGTKESYGTERLHLTLGDGWDALTISAIFTNHGSTEVIMDADGMITVPPEATANNTLPMRRGRVVFKGTAEGVQRISADLEYTVDNHAPAEGDNSIDPTPDQYTQFVQQVKDAAAGAESGATFTPSVSIDGELSWSNDKGLENPDSVNIMGPAGADGTTPHIGDNGNWWIGAVDTGVTAGGTGSSDSSQNAALTFTGAVEATYDGSTPLTVAIPKGSEEWVVILDGETNVDNATIVTTDLYSSGYDEYMAYIRILKDTNADTTLSNCQYHVTIDGNRVTYYTTGSNLENYQAHLLIHIFPCPWWDETIKRMARVDFWASTDPTSSSSSTKNMACWGSDGVPSGKLWINFTSAYSGTIHHEIWARRKCVEEV